MSGYLIIATGFDTELDARKCEPFSVDTRLGANLYATPNAVRSLRAALSIPAPPGLTEEQAEVARIEAELDAAKDADLYRGYSRDYGADGHQYVLSCNNGPDRFAPPRPTRLEAAREALVYVRALRAEAERKRLPEPEEMTQHDREDELDRRGWQHAYGGPAEDHHQRPIWMDVSGEADTERAWPQENEPWEVSTCRALREARRHDGDV